MANSLRQNLYLEISRDLVAEELTDLRHYVGGAKILPAGFVEKSNAHQICTQLEKEQKLKPGDLSLLADLLRRIGRHDYAENAEKIAENERKELPEKPKSTASWRHQPIAPTRSHPQRKRRKFEEMPSPMLMAISETRRTADSHSHTPLSEEQTQNPIFLDTLKQALANEDLSMEDRLRICRLKKELKDMELDTIYKHQEKRVKSLKEARTFLSPESLEAKYDEIQAKVEEERALVIRVFKGCLILFLDFETKSDFEHFWGSYKSGKLSDTLSRVIITDEMTRVENRQKLIRTLVLEEDYRAWRDFFSKGLAHTISADNLLALPPPARHVDCSSLSGLDLAVVARENQPSADGTGDISTLNFTVRQHVQKVPQSCKEKLEQHVRQKEVQLETTQGQVQSAREDTEAMVRSLTREITRLRSENEEAQKILMEQKSQIQKFQESSMPREAGIEQLKAENTKLLNQVADIPELRDEVRKLREKDETSQKGLSEQKQEIQQLQDTIKTREARIEELTAENTKLSKQVAEGHDQLERLREKEETPLKALSEQEQETQQLLETYKGNAAAQTEDQGSAKHTVEEKSQGEELMLEETQSGAEDKGQGTELEVEPNLSREVSLAVLPRLNKEELRRELEDRKDITVTTEGSQDKLMKRLCDEMVKEYSDQLASSTSLGSSTRNRPMQDASTQREETNEAAPIKVAHSGPTGTADTEPMLRATIGAKGIDDAGAGKQRDSQEMQDAVRLRVQPSMTESQNPGSWDAAGPSSIAIAKRTREQETKFGPSTPLKRSKTGEETTRKDVTMNVAPTSGNTRAAEATTAKTVLSPNFATPKSGIVTGAGPGSIAIPGMPSPQRAGNNLTCPCGYKARFKIDLQQHAVQTEHKPFQCDNSKCSFKTSYYQSLKKHQRTHEKKVDFLSSFPGRGFHY